MPAPSRCLLATAALFASNIANCAPIRAQTDSTQQPAMSTRADSVADIWVLRDILNGVPATGTNTFGDAVSVSNDRLAMGAYNSPCPAPLTGICGDAFVFHYSPTGSYTRYQVSSPAPSAGAGYGVSVAIDGDWLIVGAPGEHRIAGYNAGNVYLFHFDADGNWMPVPLQTPDDDGALLGQSVAISASGIAVAGMPHQSRTSPPALTNNGAVATFTRDAGGDWSYEGVLRTATPQSGEFFGSAVALHAYVIPPGILTGYGIAVGAPGTSVLGYSNAGQGFVLTRSTTDTQWSQAGFYNLGFDAHADARFGAATAIQGAVAAFGVPRRTTIVNGPAYGSVYFVRRMGTDWSNYASQEITFNQDDSEFGSAVALHGDDAFVGAPGFTFSTPGNGTVVQYHYDAGAPGAWHFVDNLLEYYPTENAHFGTSVGFDGARLAVGSPGSTLFGHPPTTDRVGIVYTYGSDTIFADGFD